MRIYIHNVDTFLGKVLVQELRKSGEGTFHRIFGSLATSKSEKPKVVKRIVSRDDPKKQKKKMTETLQSCGLVVLDLSSCSIDDLHFIIQALKVDSKSDPPKIIGEGLERTDPLTFVLVSSVMVWANTPPKETGNRCLQDSDYASRVPAAGSKYEQWKDMEDLVMKCFNQEESKVKCFVVAPGVLYGEGEETFGDLFRSAWLDERRHTISSPGTNRIPTVHVRDCARLVKHIGLEAEGLVPTERPYFIAVDQPPAPPKPTTPPAPAEPSHETALETDGAPVDDGGEATAGAEDGEEEPPPEPPAEVVAEPTPETAEEGQEEKGAWPVYLPSTQAEILQGIVDELSQHYEVPIVDSSESLTKLGIRSGGESGEEVFDPEAMQAAMHLDLWMEPSDVMNGEGYAANADPPGWVCRHGLLKNAKTVANEFCKERTLRAIRAVIGGPPASGKTTLAASVASHFNVPHLELTPDAEELIAHSSGERIRGVEEMVAYLSSNICLYRGYVLDVGPVGFEEAERLFRYDIEIPPTEEEEEAAAADGDGDDAETRAPLRRIERRLNEAVCPEFVIVTQAAEPLCRARWTARGVGSLDEFAAAADKYNKANLLEGQHSFADFFQAVANIGVLNLPIAGKEEDDMLESARIYVEKTGRPYNYLRSEHEYAAELIEKRSQREAAEVERLAAAAREQQAGTGAQEREEERKHADRMRAIASHEEACAELQALPLREYLMRYMVPNLTEGLIEICKVVPEDPVDYLAAYLEQHASRSMEP